MLVLPEVERLPRIEWRLRLKLRRLVGLSRALDLLKKMSTNQQALIAALSAASPTLLENLISYWKLDESSGDAADSIGGNTLTNTNTVTYASAKINNGAVLSDASKQTLRKASNTIFPTGSATSVSAWVKFNSFGAVGYPSTIVT